LFEICYIQLHVYKGGNDPGKLLELKNILYNYRIFKNRY